MKTIGPSVLLMKQAQIICDRFPYFDFVRTFCGAYFSLLFWHRRTQFPVALLSFCTAHSSDQITRFQSSTVQCWCALAQARRFFACSDVNNGEFTALHLRIPFSRSRCLIVCTDASIFDRFFSSLNGTWVYDSALRTRWCIVASESIRGLPDRGRFSIESRSQVRLTNLVIVLG